MDQGSTLNSDKNLRRVENDVLVSDAERFELVGALLSHVAIVARWQTSSEEASRSERVRKSETLLRQFSQH